jgi:hypothetical protein
MLADLLLRYFGDVSLYFLYNMITFNGNRFVLEYELSSIYILEIITSRLLWSGSTVSANLDSHTSLTRRG